MYAANPNVSVPDTHMHGIMWFTLRHTMGSASPALGTFGRLLTLPSLLQEALTLS